MSPGSGQPDQCLPSSHASTLRMASPRRTGPRRSVDSAPNAPSLCGKGDCSAEPVRRSPVAETEIWPVARRRSGLAATVVVVTCTVLMRRTPANAGKPPGSSRQEWAPIRAGQRFCPPVRRHPKLLDRRYQPRPWRVRARAASALAGHPQCELDRRRSSGRAGGERRCAVPGHARRRSAAGHRAVDPGRSAESRRDRVHDAGWGQWPA